MKKTLAYPSYYDIEKGCARIANDVLKSGSNIKLIVGLSRGGLIPAVIISHILDVPMVSLEYSSVKGRGDDLNHANILPDFDENNLLIVDDICDSGMTMDEVTGHYRSHFYDVITAALYVKEGSVLLPEIFWQLIPKDAPWIVFPWEL